LGGSSSRSFALGLGWFKISKKVPHKA
jgi:hypothetical protein